MKAFLKKLTSRKFLLALAAAVCGIATALGADGEVIETITGAAVTLISTVAYCLVEGAIDKKSA